MLISFFYLINCQIPAIIPVYITKNPHIFSKVYVIFGKKIDVPTNISKDKEELAKYSNMILDTIYDMGKANEKK